MRKKLPINDLSSRHTGLTPATANYFYEGARVCLDRHHNSPVDFAIRGDGREQVAQVEWVVTDVRTRAAWANEIDTTEAGAYCVALASVETHLGLVAVRRAETLTGADYYIAPEGTEPSDLEECLRLEVSGVDAGNQATIEQRLKAKVAQAEAGKSNLPAVAGVVGFGERLVRVRRVQSS